MSGELLDHGPTLAQWSTYVPPDGPCAGHTVLVRKVKPVTALMELLVSQCLTCRERWSWMRSLAGEVSASELDKLAAAVAAARGPEDLSDLVFHEARRPPAEPDDPGPCAGLPGGCRECIAIYRRIVGNELPYCVLCGTRHWAYESHLEDGDGQ